MKRFLPFTSWFYLLSRESFKSDFIAGLTGAVVVLPQGVAFAMIAGLPPEYGLYTAIVPPIIAALFGSSLHLISGPTTAISIVIFSTISPFAQIGTSEFIALTLTLTLLAGVFQLLLGLVRLGILVNFVSHTVVIGFTAGAGILIGTSQMKHVLGITIPLGGTFWDIGVEIMKNIHHTNLSVLAVAVVTFTAAVGIRLYNPKLPNLLLAILLGSGISILLGGEEAGIRLVGKLPEGLPPLSLPDLSYDTLRQLAPGAFAVALLGLIEAVSIARSIAAKSNQTIDGNREFIGQGLSNVIGPFFSSYAASGSFTRSGINYDSGAKTPFSAVFAALFLAIILLTVAPLTAYLPIASMGAVILLVAYKLINFHHIKGIMESRSSEAVILIATFFSTLFLELEFAIYLGVLLSLFFYLNRTTHPRIVHLVPDNKDSARRFINREKSKASECPQLSIIRIDGSLYFGAVNYVSEKVQSIGADSPSKSLLIVSNGINFIDIAGAEFLAQEATRRRKLGGDLSLCGIKILVEDVLEKGGYRDVIGKGHIYSTKNHAIKSIFKGLDKNTCRNCNSVVFQECLEVNKHAIEYHI